MGRNIRVCPLVQLKPIEGQGLWPQRDLRELGPDLGVELVAVHPAVSWRVPVTDQAGQERGSHDFSVSQRPSTGFQVWPGGLYRR